MFGSAVLDVAIGLMYLYALLALINSAVVEMVITYAGDLRVQTLARTIQRMLDPGAMPPESGIFRTMFAGVRNRLAKSGTLVLPPAPGELSVAGFFNHPLILSMSSAPGKPPTYLEPATVANVLIDLACKGRLGYQTARTTLDSKMDVFEAALVDLKGDPAGGVPASPLYVPLQSIADKVRLAETSLDRQLAAFHAGVEQWFREVSDRAQGWLKRKTQVVSLTAAAVLCIFANADTFELAERLSVDQGFRDDLVRKAEASVKAGEGQDANSPVAKSVETCRSKAASQQKDNAASGNAAVLTPDQSGKLVDCLHDAVKTEYAAAASAFSLGWKRPPPTTVEEWQAAWREVFTLKKLAGLLLTTIAVSLGATFWFKLLESMLRLTGRKPGGDDATASAARTDAAGKA